MMRLRALVRRGLLRPWKFLGLALSSTLSRRTEEVLIKFVGHFVLPSDWLPSILSFLSPPAPSSNLLCSSLSSSLFVILSASNRRSLSVSFRSQSPRAEERKFYSLGACVATFSAKENRQSDFLPPFSSFRRTHGLLGHATSGIAGPASRS